VVLVAILLAVALVGTTGGVIVSIRRPLPAYDGRVALSGLTSTAEVRRDAQGIPQIYADTPEDLFRVQGFVHAQDRFYEMDFRRHLTSGRLAEWFGEDLVETDAVIRTLGWRRVAAREFPKLSTKTRGYLEAYAAGVNAYLADHTGSRLSVEYTLGLLGPDERPEAWTPVDSLAWLKAMAWDLRSNLDDEVDRALASVRVPDDRVGGLYPPYPFDRHRPIVGDTKTAAASPVRTPGRATLPAGTDQALRRVRDLIARASDQTSLGGATSGIGSNSWVVSGRHTTTGKPLLANDPHLAPSMPSIWYQAGLHCRRISTGCPYDVAGFTFAGVPGVIIGHNNRIAWGFTNLGPDVMDLYVERLDGNTYMYDGARLPLTTRREIIGVKGGDPVSILVRSTRHGPLLSDVDEDTGDAVLGARTGKDARAGGWKAGVALRWTALDAGRTAEAIFRLNTARDWNQFRAAAAMFEVPAQNIVYADVDGHIGYQAPGRIPIRKPANTGEWPVPGWTSRYEWEGFVPFERLPSVRDPAEGYIVTANQAVVPADYPYHLADHWSYGYRSDRIGDLLRAQLKGQGKVDVAAMQRIQLDTYNANAAFLVPLLQKVEVDSFTAQGVALFRGWNFTQGARSAPAAYFNAVWRNLLAETFQDELPRAAWPSGGDRWYEVMRRLVRDPDNAWWDDVRTRKVREDRDAIFERSLREARKELTKLLAKDPRQWRWGRLHQLELTNQSFGQSGFAPLERLFNRGPYEVSGGSDAVLATGWTAGDKRYTVTAVPSMRMVVDLADFDRSRWINLTGTSGHPWSDQYMDQVDMWVRGESLAWPFSRPAVEESGQYTMTVMP
jgi:penicillin G amidase